MLNYKDKTGSTFYKAILQNLFFATLNNEMGEKRTFIKRQYGIQNYYRYERFFINKERFLELTKDIPFLNGGLFENLDKNVGKENEIRIDCFSNRIDKEQLLKIPDFLFFSEEKTIDLNRIYDTKGKTYKVKGLIKLLNSYKFTITENTPLEEDVALDPELLGKVFENLLASYNPETQKTARSQTGSFYTPREIVSYMVDESIKMYLQQVTNYEIQISNGEFQVDNTITNELNYNIIKALNNVRILDPACGSGAFPMGILHRMVEILQKLDPDNKEWRKLQKQSAILETEEAYNIGDKEERQKRLLDIDEAFDNNTSDYGRKLFLIENCIFGVDIQPIAAQISKLRFFISLICEQTPNPDKPNFGIRPLPNLETKFVAANTLIGLEKQGTLFHTEEIVKKENELKEVRHKHFLARTPDTKAKYRDKDESLRYEIANILTNLGYPEDTAQKLALWNPYDQNASASFFDAEWMFGLSQKTDGLNGTQGVFDIVIGNPPYGATIGASDKIYFKKNYESSKTIKDVQTGSLDTFSVFIEKGYNLIKINGILNYIVPMSVISSDSMTSLHNLLLANCKEIRVASFSERPQQPFPNACQATSILLLRRTNTPCDLLLTTKKNRWNKGVELQMLIDNLKFTQGFENRIIGRIPKVSYKIEHDILSKLFSEDNQEISRLIDDNGKPIYYRMAGGRYFKVITNYPTNSSAEKLIRLSEEYADCIGLFMSSTLFWWYIQVYADDHNLKLYEIETFKIPIKNLTNNLNILNKLYKNYLDDIESNSKIDSKGTKKYKIRKSRYLIDQIDDIICPLYGLTQEETDFIKNYEIEFRLSDND
jgi:predicted RNA methylase